MATGRTPNREGIGLESAGVELTDRGYIKVNERLETTAPEVWAVIGLSETEAKSKGIAYRLVKIPMAADLRTRTLSETRGFMKALLDIESDRILGFTVFGVDGGEIMGAVQIAMIAGLPHTALQDAVLTHPTLLEGLVALFSSAPLPQTTGS